MLNDHPLFRRACPVRLLRRSGPNRRINAQRRFGRKPMDRISQNGLSKVPEVTLAFWIIKIAATTLGETAGDAVSMSMHLGYADSSAIFIGIFVVAVGAQIAAK